MFGEDNNNYFLSIGIDDTVDDMDIIEIPNKLKNLIYKQGKLFNIKTKEFEGVEGDIIEFKDTGEKYTISGYTMFPQALLKTEDGKEKICYLKDKNYEIIHRHKIFREEDCAIDALTKNSEEIIGKKKGSVSSIKVRRVEFNKFNGFDFTPYYNKVIVRKYCDKKWDEKNISYVNENPNNFRTLSIGIKDCNGKNIFEGDIITVNGVYPKLVKYIPERAGFYFANLRDFSMEEDTDIWQRPNDADWWNRNKIEIVGNVFENSLDELMKKYDE